MGGVGVFEISLFDEQTKFSSSEASSKEKLKLTLRLSFTSKMQIAVEVHTGKADRVHPHIEVKYQNQSFGVYAKAHIPSNTIVWISPSILTIKPADDSSKVEITDQSYYRSSGWVTSIIDVLINNGLLDKDSSSYSPHLLELFQFLHPRSENLQEEYQNGLSPSKEQLFAKLHRNGIAGKNFAFRLMKYGNLFNNSCIPNAICKSTPDETEVKIVAVKDIQPGEEVTISYNHLWPVDDLASRRERWKEYGFSCQCRACVEDIPPSSLVTEYLPYFLLAKHCWFCGSEKALRCTGCGTAYYCGEECQRKGWNVHSRVCKKLKDMTYSEKDIEEKVDNHIHMKEIWSISEFFGE